MEKNLWNLLWQEAWTLESCLLLSLFFRFVKGSFRFLGKLHRKYRVSDYIPSTHPSFPHTQFHLLTFLLVWTLLQLVNILSKLFLIALQRCVVFCSKSTCINHRYPQGPSLLNLRPPPTPGHPAGYAVLSRSLVSDSATPWAVCSSPGSSVHADSPGKNTEVGFQALLQGSSPPRVRTRIFPPQVSNLGLPRCRWVLYSLSHQGGPTPLDCQRAPGWAPCVIRTSPAAVLHVVMWMFQCYSLSWSHRLLPLLVFISVSLLLPYK